MTTKEKVLVIDDDVDIRETLEEVLEHAGYTAVLADGGPQGLELLAGGLDPVVVLLDMVMPEMDGRAVLEALRADPRLASIPVIIVSSEPERAPEGVPFLRKPARIDELVRAIEKHSRAA